MNTELLSRLGGIAVSCIIIMAFIVVACLVTPRLARWLEKRSPGLTERLEKRGILPPERVEDAATGRDPQETYEAHSAFESSKDEDFDPNYKIYHEDIYGWKLKK